MKTTHEILKKIDDLSDYDLRIYGILSERVRNLMESSRVHGLYDDAGEALALLYHYVVRDGAAVAFDDEMIEDFAVETVADARTYPLPVTPVYSLHLLSIRIDESIEDITVEYPSARGDRR